MKKFLALLLVAVTIVTTGLVVSSQVKKRTNTDVVLRNNSGTAVAVDTLTDSDNNTIGHPVNYPWNLTFNYKITRTEGTLAGGCYLLGTNDSVNGPWRTVQCDVSQCLECVSDTATFTNAASNTVTWRVPHSPFSYYRAYTYTTGTVTAVVSLTTVFDY